MDDDQPYEGLHTDNDFEGGEWIGGEFFFKNKVTSTAGPLSLSPLAPAVFSITTSRSYCTHFRLWHCSQQKQKRQQTKQEQLYGVFADDSDDENESRKGRGRSSGGKADFTKPVAFVSTGETVQPRKQEAEPSRCVPGRASTRCGQRVFGSWSMDAILWRRIY